MIWCVGRDIGVAGTQEVAIGRRERPLHFHMSASPSLQPYVKRTATTMRPSLIQNLLQSENVYVNTFHSQNDYKVMRQYGNFTAPTPRRKALCVH